MKETISASGTSRAVVRTGTKLLRNILTSEGGSTVVRRGVGLGIVGLAFMAPHTQGSPAPEPAPLTIISPTPQEKTIVHASEQTKPEITLTEAYVNDMLSETFGNTEAVNEQQLAYMQLAADTIGEEIPEWYNLQQINDLTKLWWRESRWVPSARNNSSGAYGIPQLNPESHMLTQSFMEDPREQIVWGINYIYDNPKLGSPSEAWQFSQEHGWY